MANITRFDPFSDMDELFRGWQLRPVGMDRANERQLQLRIDVTRTDDTYTVKAEMPGVSKEDIDVTVDGNQVTISGERREEKEEKKGKEMIHSERYHGVISRSFLLPQEVDEARAVARSADGVLTLTLPVRAKSATRKIAVN